MILIGTEDPVDSSYAAQPLAALLLRPNCTNSRAPGT